MATIKLKRGSGDPAGNLEQYEVAMDVAAKNLYTSTDGSDAVILADNTLNTLSDLPDDTMEINGIAGVWDAVINVKTDNSGFNRPQITLEDSNNKVFSLIANNNDDRFKYIIMMDPDGNENASGGFSGDYGFYYTKNYSNGTSNMTMDHTIYGAKEGFRMTVHDDYNGGSPNPGPFPNFGGYGYKPFIVRAENFEVRAADSDTSVATSMTVNGSQAEFQVPIGHAQLASDPSGPSNGWTYYNTTTHKLRLYANGAWVDLN